jgi:phospholipase/lecithinase/hemolysin
MREIIALHRGISMCFKGIFVCVGICAASASFGFSNLYVFGDSLSDTGNDFAEVGTPPPPYYDGRFSNGPIWIDDLAAKLGVTDPAPSVLGGTDYAFGGSTATNISTVAPTISQEIGFFVTTGPGTFKSTDLVSLWGGANDFLNGELNPSLPASAIGADINSLYALGARNIIVPNLPDLGEVPLAIAQGPSTVAFLQTESAEFDVDLAAQIAAAQASDPGLRIYAPNVAGFVQGIMNDPGAYGFTDTTDELINAPAGTNPSTYLFWDDVHPTAAGQALIADLAFQAVPEPSAMVCLGFGVLVLLRRRKK